jgi:cold-inducible RNA-binding protein
LPAHRSERIVRYSGHRRQNHRWPDTHLSDIHSQEFSGFRKLNVTVNGTSVDRMHRSYVTNNLESQLPRNRTRGVNEMARLYIGNLPHVATEYELQTWIEGHGFKVDAVQVIKDLDTGASRGFAFVELPEVIDPLEAVNALNGQKMEGHNLRISPARPVPLKTDGRQAGGTRSPKKRAS